MVWVHLCPPQSWEQDRVDLWTHSHVPTMGQREDYGCKAQHAYKGTQACTCYGKDTIPKCTGLLRLVGKHSWKQRCLDKQKEELVYLALGKLHVKSVKLCKGISVFAALIYYKPTTHWTDAHSCWMLTMPLQMCVKMSSSVCPYTPTVWVSPYTLHGIPSPAGPIPRALPN